MPRETAAAIEHKIAMDAIGFAAQLLTPQAEILTRLIEAEQQMHSYMHVTDPTTYRAAINSAALRQQVAIAKAALAFVLAVQQVKMEIANQ